MNLNAEEKVHREGGFTQKHKKTREKKQTSRKASEKKPANEERTSRKVSDRKTHLPRRQL